MGKEIERKFVLAQVPRIELGLGTPMVQGYIPLPLDNVVQRVRDEGGKKVLTLKSAGTSVRDEVNIDLSAHPEIFSLLVENTNGAVRKTRYLVTDGDGFCELDIYEGDNPSLAGRIVVEREFVSEIEMADWEVPNWMRDSDAVEVTGDPRYLNSSLLAHGWPD